MHSCDHCVVTQHARSVLCCSGLQNTWILDGVHQVHAVLGGGRSLFTLESYADCLMTSGAIQKGVPTNVCRLLVVLVSCPATPKSASFTSPDSDNSTLAAARSKQNGERKRTKLASDLVSARQKHHYSDVRKPADKTSFLALAPRRQM